MSDNLSLIFPADQYKMTVIDANPASLHMGTHGWNSCRAASLVMQMQAALQKYTLVFLHSLVKTAPSCISVQVHKAFGITACTTEREGFFQHRVWFIYIAHP